MDKDARAAALDKFLENPSRDDPFGGTALGNDVTFTDLDFHLRADGAPRNGDTYLLGLDRELKEGVFGDVDLEDFSDFENVGSVWEQGTYSFTVEGQFFKHAASIIHEVSDADVVRVTAFPHRLKLAVANTAAFVEILVPAVVTQAVNLSASQTVAFILQKRKLINTAQSVRDDATIRFDYLADRQSLTIRDGAGVLNLPTSELAQFPNYHQNCGMPKLLSELDPTALGDALRFLRSYVIRDALQPNLSLIDFHAAAPALPQNIQHTETGRGVSGSGEGIGVYDCTRLPRVPLRITYNAVNVAAQLLRRFHPAQTRLFRAGNFFLVRDQNLYFGFDASEYPFPPVGQILAARADSHMLILREEMECHLIQLSVVNSDASTSVRFLVAGAGNSAKLILEVRDVEGKVSCSAMTVARRANDEFIARGGNPTDLPDLDFSVNLAKLMSTIAYSKTANVLMELTGVGLRIIHATEDAQAISTLSVLKQAAPHPGGSH